MSIFSNLDNGNVATDPKDSLGGVGGFDGPSGVYTAEVVQAYGITYGSGTRAVSVTLKINNQEVNSTLFIADKNGRTYNEYGDKRTEKPGFTRVKELVSAVTRGGLDTADVGEGMIKAWSKDERKFTLQRNSEVFRALTGATVQVALKRVIRNKQVKVGEEYQDTNDKVTQYEIMKFANARGLTLAEIMDNATEGTFLKEWQAKYGGIDDDRFKFNPNAVTEGTPPPAASAPAKFSF